MRPQIRKTVRRIQKRKIARRVGILGIATAAGLIGIKALTGRHHMPQPKQRTPAGITRVVQPENSNRGTKSNLTWVDFRKIVKKDVQKRVRTRKTELDRLDREWRTEVQKRIENWLGELQRNESNLLWNCKMQHYALQGLPLLDSELFEQLNREANKRLRKYLEGERFAEEDVYEKPAWVFQREEERAHEEGTLSEMIRKEGGGPVAQQLMRLKADFFEDQLARRGYRVRFAAHSPNYPEGMGLYEGSQDGQISESVNFVEWDRVLSYWNYHRQVK